jgi:glycosyltransferase involved in cell wall biosynthesis
MKNNPILSIVTINYNNALGLEKTLSSIFETKPSYQIESIVIDGGSSDNSMEIIKNFASAITYWQSEKDNGIYDAMNIGLAKATGQYVWFLNSGDLVYDNQTLSLLHQCFENNWDVIYGETLMVDAEYKEIGKRSVISGKPLPETLVYNSFSYGMSVGHQSIIAKTSLAPQYNLKWKHVADIDWVLNMLKNKPSTSKTEFIISRFALDGHSSQNRKSANKERYHLLKEHYGFLSNFINHLVIGLRAVFR